MPSIYRVNSSSAAYESSRINTTPYIVIKEFDGVIYLQGCQRRCSVKLTLEPSAGGEQTILEVDVVFISAGRTPFTAGLDLDKIGVNTDNVSPHKAEKDGVTCVEFIAGKEGHVDYDMVPGLYTLTLRWHLLERLRNRAKAIDDAKGLVKIIVEKESDKILGVHIMSPNAGELIHER
ncbi:hypothetical protein IFM89_009438 [Coptis chinensis]|uniref:Pyridine nucleotide-disulphide oxidoreductase dimerisation domain-containing protein n=1 Tax=Coptis chinensis TaxID=261450 RepID=A0A835M251_9MAGN|nr:hypothetical protein IFM89_009438 [Coptis chinensis]